MKRKLSARLIFAILLTSLAVLAGVYTLVHTGRQEIAEEPRSIELQAKLQAYVDSVEAADTIRPVQHRVQIGIAVIIDGRDTVSVNGSEMFPLMSVVKFPQALAIAAAADKGGSALSELISYDRNDLIANTYSPMVGKYGARGNMLSLDELLYWSLAESDNNACDILFRHLGGTAQTKRLVDGLYDGAGHGLAIGATEAEMDADHEKALLNAATPLAMAGMMDRFYTELRPVSKSFAKIAEIMEQCSTGGKRLPAPLGPDVVIGHKTGTGFIMENGRNMAINDCGYIVLPGGRHYSIAVFMHNVDNDRVDEPNIGEISAIVYNHLIR